MSLSWARVLLVALQSELITFQGEQGIPWILYFRVLALDQWRWVVEWLGPGPCCPWSPVLFIVTPRCKCALSSIVAFSVTYKCLKEAHGTGKPLREVGGYVLRRVIEAGYSKPKDFSWGSLVPISLLEKGFCDWECPF